MADTREQTSTTTNSASTGTVEIKPGVEVYDTDQPSTTPLMHDEDRTLGTTTHTVTTSDAESAGPDINWGLIVLGILIVLALIFLATRLL